MHGQRAVAGCLALPTAMVGICLVVMLVAALAPQHLVPIVAIVAGTGLLSGFLCQEAGRRARGEREQWAREVRRLEHQLELMRQKQTRLQETITWQGRLLEQTLAAPEAAELSRIEISEDLL